MIIKQMSQRESSEIIEANKGILPSELKNEKI